MMLTEEQTERLKFLRAYEDLGPGGLTPEESRELAELQTRAAFNAITFDDADAVDDDEINNTGNISIEEDLKYFFEKLMKNNIFKIGDIT